jgi:murein DD-endopeptidase MepM/ murein hydrolase activator NlpD
MKLAALAAVAALVLGAGTARAGGGQVIGFSVASSGSLAALAPPVALPSAASPNAPGAISVPVDFTQPPAVEQRVPLSGLDVLWHRAGAAYGVPWQVLAAIDKVESNFGQNMGPSSAGAVGWMQFMPDTWLRWGVDADGNGIADPWNAADAIFSAARYLAASGGQTDISRAVFSYNHADWYVNEVLQLANVFGQGGAQETASLQQLQRDLDGARRALVRANRTLVGRVELVRAMALRARRLHARVAQARLLSDRLAAERAAVLYDARVDRARRLVGDSRSSVQDAQTSLQRVEQRAAAPSFAPGVSTVLSGPAFGNGYVFPVGGGPGVVSAAHTHHDYPAVDIAAPEGSPVYSLADATVLNAWHTPDPRCGIGMTFRASDGQVWTYCHLAYLAPAIQDGTQLAAGESVGLVGHTGDATGPHLHLQLQPPTAWPQAEGWFQSFAGRAFSWQDAPTPTVAVGPAVRTFAVARTGAEPVIAFTP